MKEKDDFIDYNYKSYSIEKIKNEPIRNIVISLLIKLLTMQFKYVLLNQRMKKNRSKKAPPFSLLQFAFTQLNSRKEKNRFE